MRLFIHLGLVALLTSACNESLLPKAVFPNGVDTVSIYALTGTAVSRASAYSMELRSPVRSDQTSSFDFAFDIDSTGQALLYPTGALKLGGASGLHITPTPFDSIRTAWTGVYQRDSAVAIDSNTVVYLHSRSVVCSFGLQTVYYG